MTTKPLLLCASGAAANLLLMACGLQNSHEALRMQHAGLQIAWELLVQLMTAIWGMWARQAQTKL